jgi:hypothetical protein
MSTFPNCEIPCQGKCESTCVSCLSRKVEPRTRAWLMLPVL